MAQKNEASVLILSLLVTLGLLIGGFWWFKNRYGANLPTANDNNPNLPLNNPSTRFSLGEKLLITSDTNPNKIAAINAFNQRDYNTAIRFFQASLQQTKNDPEAVIYLNNAKAALAGKVNKIAINVPISSNVNVAKELLRGVAQAQDEVNNTGGINGVPLQVQIGNDENNPNIAKNIAQQLVKDSSILAVIGHNASEASLAAAPVYQQGKLVMISPTSHAKSLSGIGNYIFRTIPSVRFDATVLSRYAQRAGLKNIAICADSQVESSQSLKEEFTANFFADGGKVTATRCDFSASDFNAQKIIEQALKDGADGLLLAASVGNLDQNIALAKANQKQLKLLGSYALYTFQTLEQSKANVEGMILAVPWHPETIANNTFTANAAKLWSGSVNWRTALAYDAAEAIIAGLRAGNNRETVQITLSNPNFIAQGATGTIQFLPSGDRNGASQLVVIAPGAKSGTGFDFVPVKP